MNNYLKELRILEEDLYNTISTIMLKTKNLILKDEYLNMFDEVDDIIIKLNTLIEEPIKIKTAENSFIEELQNKIEQELLKNP